MQVGKRTFLLLHSLLFLIGSLLASMQLALAVDSQSGALVDQQKNALIEAQKKFTSLEPWQMTVFQEEVLPGYQRFIKGLRQSETGVDVQVDQDSLRRYLAFYGPKNLKQKDPKILVYLRAEPGCAKCAEAVPEIQRLVKTRLEHRGMIPVWLQPEESGLGRLQGKPLEDRAADLAVGKNASGAVVVQWQVAPIDDLDSAHADEKRFLIQTFMMVREVAKTGSKNEILDNDLFEVYASRHLTDALTEMGTKVELAESGSDASRGEVTIEVKGIRDFGHYTRTRTQLGAKLQDMGSIEDRAFSRGRVVFSIFTSRTADEMKRRLSALGTDPTWDKTLQVEIR